MRTFFAYVRVSTARQGEHGVSLQEQRDAIARDADRNGFSIAQWFEERETAAKRGRPVFTHMLKLLRAGKAGGVVIHKIDRSARNLKDWAELGELSDRGIEIRFTQESLDLHSRGGRLSADIMAVVAADYVRNLREETKKGFYGRLKQGVYPLPAPLGYRDVGAGKPKEPDPAMASLVRRAFELYATGNYGLKRLGEELARHGLRNRHGGRVTINGLSKTLNNPFYVGVIRLKRTGETFAGAHEPLVSKVLFERVQALLHGKTQVRTSKHEFLFRRLLKCKTCGYSLIGESQRGHVYYRCQSTGCPTTCIREETVDAALTRRCLPLRFTADDQDTLRPKIVGSADAWETQREEGIRNASLRADGITAKLTRLTDAYLDGVLDKDMFNDRKAALLLERREAEELVTTLKTRGDEVPNRLAEFLELASALYYGLKTATPEEKRDLLRIVTSNITVDGKNVDITLAPPFCHVAERQKNAYGAPCREEPRTSDELVETLWKWFQENPESALVQYLARRQAQSRSMLSQDGKSNPLGPSNPSG